MLLGTFPFLPTYIHCGYYSINVLAASFATTLTFGYKSHRQVEAATRFIGRAGLRVVGLFGRIEEFGYPPLTGTHVRLASRAGSRGLGAFIAGGYCMDTEECTQ